MTRTPKRRRRLQLRAGFTIVETVVAIMILTVGVLGLAGASAIVARNMGSAEAQSDAASLAARRFELMRSTRCTNLANGNATVGNLTEKWVVSPQVGSGYRMYGVTDSVRFRRVRGQRTQVYQSVIQCLP